ncbi:hypothetical protein Ahy_B02g061058 [Arachis hypogaea]|uniref:Replication factor A C-terminal domain-containing protein n=1 Tax=Arachis hypogaea TaxID=3818 RepID=A0A445AJX5_ARAHY|nr:hypothetical protein Ahy_B02g061058 [Arachis hypogaea]
MTNLDGTVWNVKSVIRKHIKKETTTFLAHVSDQSATTTFVLFDGEAKKLLNTTTSNLITLQKSNDIEAPPQLKNLCNFTLIFEVKLNDFNLKEGSQQYTVTKTFVPTKNTEPQHPLQQIK